MATVLPLSLAAGISPMMLSEQMLLLAGRGGRRSALAYVAGTATIVLALLAAVLAIGANLELPRAPRLSGRVDVTVGALLLVLAVVGARRPHPVTKRPDTPHERGGFGRSYAFGLFAMATNVTTLPMVIAAGKDVVAHGSDGAVVLLGMSVILVGACLPAWAPLVLAQVPGGSALLDRLPHLIAANGRRIVILAITAAGVFCLVKGVLQLL